MDTTLKVYVYKTNSRYWSMGVYILFAPSLEEAKDMFFQKMRQVSPDIELDAQQLFSEWQVEEREIAKGFIYEQSGMMMA